MYTRRNHLVPVDGANDHQLAAAAQEGNAHAFEALYDRHKRRIYSLCLRMMHNAAEAEDLTQDTFMQVFRKLDTFRGEAAFSTWLHRLAVNTVLMHIRKRRLPTVSFEEPETRQDDDFEVPRQYGEHDRVLASAGERLDLLSAVDDLPPGYRLIFILHDVEGYEHCEIAEILGCTTGNSKSQLHKARLKLRRCLQTRRWETRLRRSKLRLRSAAAGKQTPWCEQPAA